MMTLYDDMASNRARAERGIDYCAALMTVGDDPFVLLANHACPLIEWCMADAMLARREGATDRLIKRMEFLSVMAGYFGASPIAKLSHHIDLALIENRQIPIDRQLVELQSEVERFIPALRLRLGNFEARA